MNSVHWLESLAQDLRYACRGLRRSPVFTAVAVMTLALGIGVNATVFTVTSAVLFKGFRSVVGNDRILYLDTQKHGRGCCVSFADFEEWRAQAATFDGMGAVADLQIILNDESGRPERYDASRISTAGFTLVGQTPILGRDFASSDEAPGAAAVAILRYDLWERRYGKDPAIKCRHRPWVSQRTQEIGIRTAIGATAGDILQLVFSQGMLPVGIGLAIGLAAALVVMPILKSQLVQVSPADPFTLVVAIVTLILSATLACLIPARRAMRVDPVVALRQS